MAANSEKGPAPWKRSLSLKIGRGREVNGQKAAAGEDEPLSPAARLFHQPGFRCFIVAIMGCGKPLDVAVVKAGLQATLARHPRFSSIPVLDEVDGGKKPRWVPTKVAVEDHIIIPNLLDSAGSGGGSVLSPDQVVEDYVASLTTTPMDPARPLWEFHVLNIPTSEAAAVAVLRLHHSLGDGTSLLSLLLACTRKASDPDALPTIPTQRPRPSPPPAMKVSSALMLLLLWIRAFLAVAWNTLAGLAVFAATALFLKDTPTPIARSDVGAGLPPKRIVHRSVSLDDIKDIKNAMHCTVNDVLVGVTSAGLSRYLSRRYGDDEDDDKKKRVPSNIRLRSTLLVNIRPIPGIHDLAELMEGKGGGTKWGNLIGYLVLPFSIGKQKDLLDYVRRAKAVMSKKKNSLEALLTYKSGDLLIKVFGFQAAVGLCKRVVKNTTLSFSNMMGPVEEIAFCDNPIVYLAPGVYGHPQALTVHFQSYMKTMKIVVTADEREIPDPHQLLDDLAHSLMLIKEALPPIT